MTDKNISDIPKISNKRRIIFASVLGVLLGFCYVAGQALDTVENVNFLDKRFYLWWLLASGIVGAACYLLWMGIEKCRNRIVAGEEQKKDRWQDRLLCLDIPYWAMVAVMLLCWLPVLLSIFPGAFSYDALDEWQQVANWELTAHHPVAHVLLLGGLVEGGYCLTGSYNVGIATYSLLQMLLLAMVFAYTLKFLKEFRVPGACRLFAFLFYCFSPVVGLFSVCATKDTLFSAVLLLFFLYVLRMFTDKEAFFAEKGNLMGLGLTAFGSMLLRNNGVYIVLVTLVLIAILCRRYLKKYLLCMLAVLLLYGAYTGPVYSLLGVTPGGVEEMLSVPIQQLARVYHYDYASLEQQDLEILYRYLPGEALEQYRSTVSDFVKKDFDGQAFAEQPGDFFRLWLKWGLEHPLTYVNSFLVGTVDFWYPHAILDGYQDVYGKSSLFDYQVDEPGQEVVLLPTLHEWLESLSHDKEVQAKPFVFLLVSPGWYLLLTCVMGGYFWCYRRYELMVPLGILLLSLGTVLLGPIALIRYVLIFYFVFPVLLGMLFYKKEVRNPQECGKR